MRELAVFEKHDFNAFPVVENGKMLGIISKFDFLRATASVITSATARFINSS
jgi:CBS domain-containing protein